MKRLLLVLMLILGAVMITSRPVATYAYTDEEKQQAKSWLSSHGYPPTRAGAEQARSEERRVGMERLMFQKQMHIWERTRKMT